LSRNFGHQAALTAGLEKANGDAIITMDGDLQHPPSVIPEMIKEWLAGNAVVYARRRGQNTGLFKRSTSHLYYKILNRASEVDMPQQVSDFRLISREIQKHLLLLGEHARYIRGLVAWLGFKHSIIDYDQADREHGEASYTFGKMLRLGMDGLLGFSMLPLRFGLWIGILAILMAGGFLAFIAYQHFVVGVFYQLYKWIIVIILGCVGLQFIFLWIVGEYIGRIYHDVRRRPLYVISESYNFDAPES